MFTTAKTLSIGFSLLAVATVVFAFAGCDGDAVAPQVCSEPQQIVREIPGGVEITGIPSRTPDGRTCELTPVGEAPEVRAAPAPTATHAAKARSRS